MSVTLLECEAVARDERPRESCQDGGAADTVPGVERKRSSVEGVGVGPSVSD